MNIVSWNVRGIGGQIKRATVKDMLRNFRADIELLQETKLSSVSQSVVKEIWGACNR